MRSNFATLVSVATALAGSMSIVGLACDPRDITTNPGALVGAAASCPDLSSIQAIAKVDWASEFKLDAAAAAKLGGGLQAALALQSFAARLDADLAQACGGLATDLGAQGDFGSAKEACQAASKAIADAKARLGAGVKLSVAIDPPHCAASMDAMADCLAQCDAELEPGRVDIQCEEGKLAGTCEGECSGSCDLEAAAVCNGTCHGSCDAKFEGQCGGDCEGTCDGKTIEGGACNGTCKGKCSAAAEGECGGKCSGSCELQGSASCAGTCRGNCSVEMKAPKCEGEMKPPKASAECNASCEADVQAKLECTPAKVAVRLDGAADADLAARYKAALETHLPGVLKIAIGMKDRALSVAADGKAVVEAAQAVVAQAKADPAIGARLTACVAAPFKGALDAALSIQVSVSVSVDVQASARASASASAG